MFTFLLIIQTLIALALIIVILMQRSEGGGLTGGGSPAGLMTARGAADFLTRATTILAAAFIVLSIVLAALAAHQGSGRTIDAKALKAQQQQQQQSGNVAPLPGTTQTPVPSGGLGATTSAPSNAATDPLPNAGPAGAPALSQPLPTANNTNGSIPAAR